MVSASEWLACAFSGKGMPIQCSVAFIIKVMVGGIAGAAFTQPVAEVTPLDHIPMIATGIGLVANRAMPGLVDKLSDFITSKVPKGDRNEP